MLKSEGYTPIIICRLNSRIQEEAIKLELVVKCVGFRNALDIASMLRLAALLRTYQPIAVICHSGHDADLSSLTVRLLSALRLLKNRPTLLRMRTYLPSKAKAFGYNLMFDQSFTPSRALREQLLRNRKINSDKVGALYPGIDFKKMRSDADAPLPIDLQQRLRSHKNAKVVLHVAMLRGEKGHAFMLQVIEELLNEFPNLLYVIAGEGYLREQLMQMTDEKMLQEAVCFLGMVNPVAPVIKNADVLVMPSTYEPLGMSQIEALGLGVPVIVSDTGGLPEIVIHNQTGQICPVLGEADSKAKWVEALSLYLSNPNLAKQHAEQGRQRVTEQI